jgi:acetolactate synthase-1/2/3 large subunit
MIVSEYIVDFLVRKGIRDIFFIEGSACASIVVSVARNKKLRYFCPLHEQAGAFAADGYFKASRKMTAMLATSGPGGQNLLNGIAASFYDSCPGFYITGQVNSRFIKPTNKIRQHGFQENDIVSMAKPITKYAVMITSAKDIRYELEKAYYLATNGRPGPVLIDVPMDIQRALVPKILRKYSLPSGRPYELNKVSHCVKMLEKAQRPVVLLGGGVWLSGAVEDAKNLAKKLRNVPFYVTWNMMDYYDPDHYCGKVGTFGGEGRNFGVQNCDLLLAIGSRISGRITGGMVWTFAREAKKIIVDVDKEEMKYQQVKGDLNICCDAKVFIRQLLKKVNPRNSKSDRLWMQRAKQWKLKYPVVREEYWKQNGSVNPYIFVKYLSSLMKRGDVLVHEAGGNCVVTSQAFEVKANQRVFSNNGNSSLGYALPAAIGACIATKKKVVCITGDGGMNFNIQELQTLKHYKLPVKVFIFGNQAFGITKAYRDTHFNSEYAGVDASHGVSFPDYVKVAEAYGIKALSIRDHKELNGKIKCILDAQEPVVCNVNMVGFYDYQPKLGWGTPIEDQYPFLPRREFRENMIIDPIKGWENPVYPGPIK